jgi:hypothetical protein
MAQNWMTENKDLNKIATMAKHHYKRAKTDAEWRAFYGVYCDARAMQEAQEGF